MGEIQQHAFRHTFNNTYEKYKQIGIRGLSLKELQTLLIGEYWMDGASWEVANESGNSSNDPESIRETLKNVFNYQ